MCSTYIISHNNYYISHAAASARISVIDALPIDDSKSIAANRLQLGMASVSSQSIEAEWKVAVVLHQGSDEEEMLNRKVWLYNTEEIQQYSLAQVEELLLPLSIL